MKCLYNVGSRLLVPFIIINTLAIIDPKPIDRSAERASIA